MAAAIGNQYAIGNNGGRPFKFKSAQEVQEKIDEYFLSCWEQKVDMFGNPLFFNKEEDKPIMVHKRPYTITGLAVALDTTRETLMDYEDMRAARLEKLYRILKEPEEKGKISHKEAEEEIDMLEEISDTIKKAKERVHQYAEESLFTGKPIGAIFNLKNNWGWKDKKEVELNDISEIRKLPADKLDEAIEEAQGNFKK